MGRQTKLGRFTMQYNHKAQALNEALGISLEKLEELKGESTKFLDVLATTETVSEVAEAIEHVLEERSTKEAAAILALLVVVMYETGLQRFQDSFKALLESSMRGEC